MSGPRAEDLTVVIPTRDRTAILRRTIDALNRQTVTGFDVVVVVDGLDQPAADLQGVTTIAKEHAGPGAARNAGVARTSRPLILFLGDDMIPEAPLVERHLARHAGSPEETVAVLGHVDWHPEVARNRILRWLDWSSSQFDYEGIAASGAGWGHFYSCNVSLKRSFFESVGGFDEDFAFYYEDLDMARRLHERGMTLLYEPGARALHLHRYSLDQVIGRYEGVARGEHMMARKHPWFTPFFAERVRQAESNEPISRVWPLIVDHVPSAATRLKRGARRRANDWYYQQIAPRFHRGWRAARELQELRDYLGDDFDLESFRGHVAAVEHEEGSAPDEETFYRTSRMYLYDLTVFAMSGTKEPYLADLTSVVPAGASLLDWGCGIGSDGLLLAERGYDVSFADFDNPSTTYLRWRLRRRGLEARVFDIEQPEIPGGFDAAYSFDVIEHVDDPFAFLSELERRARLVAVNLLEPAQDDTHLHKPLPIPALLEHARGKGLVRYRKYHGRSHFVIYRS
jgi:GT2 family glycosyltransferase/2-polyprenyl-3-methyl-5-hydroxy-6-metoxy-1,4-benzoquinol methylase